MKKFIFTSMATLIATALSGTLHAQKFETDPIFEDSVKAVRIVHSENGWGTADPYSEISLPENYTIEMVEMDNGAIIFEKDGNYYKISQGEVVFSRDNDRDAINPLDGEHARRHSFLGHFFAGITPYLIIVILILGGTAFGLIGQKNAALRETALKVLPISLGLASLLEILAYWTLGSDMTWWCDKDRLGFWGSLLAAIPFVAVVLMQYYSIRLYNKLLFPNGNEDNTDTPQKISLKPIATGIILFIPVLIAMLLIFSKLLNWDGTIPDILSLLAAVLVSAFLIRRGYRKNVECFGQQKGLMITIFSSIYLLGLIITGLLALVVIFKIIFQIIIIAVAAVAFIYLMSATEKYQPTQSSVRYYAKDGSKHEFSADAESRNREIDARKNK